MVTKSFLSDSPHVNGKETKPIQANPHDYFFFSPFFPFFFFCVFFLQPSAICRRNDWCPAWVCIEIKYRHYPRHNCKHNYSNSNDVNAQTSFHLKEKKNKAETHIKTPKKVFEMLKFLFRGFCLKLTMSITVK